MFQPRLDILPAAQKALWPELAEVPANFVLYGGTALALRLGHRHSVDFDFFSSEPITPQNLLRYLHFLHQAKVLQNQNNTLTVAVTRGSRVKISFFGNLNNLGRVGQPDHVSDNNIAIASLLDIAGCKAAVIAQRAEQKDYTDLLAIIDNPINKITLPTAIAAARAICGEQYNPLLTLKALMSFTDGDLAKLSSGAQKRCCDLAVAVELKSLPLMERSANHLA